MDTYSTVLWDMLCTDLHNEVERLYDVEPINNGVWIILEDTAFLLYSSKYGMRLTFFPEYYRCEDLSPVSRMTASAVMRDIRDRFILA